MEGCTDGRVSGWMNGWTDEWWVGRWIAAQVSGWSLPWRGGSRELGDAGSWARLPPVLSGVGRVEGPSQEDGLFLFWSRSPFPTSCLLGRPCTCHPAGSLGTCDPRSGRCPCKENVEGSQCDRWVSLSGNEPVRSGLRLAVVRGAGGRVLADLGCPPPGTFLEPMALPSRKSSAGFITLLCCGPAPPMVHSLENTFLFF